MGVQRRWGYDPRMATVLVRRASLAACAAVFSAAMGSSCRPAPAPQGATEKPAGDADASVVGSSGSGLESGSGTGSDAMAALGGDAEAPTADASVVDDDP